MFNPLNLISRLIKSSNQKELDRINKIVNKINSLEDSIKKLSDQDFPKKTQEFRDFLKKGKNLNEILPEAFALHQNYPNPFNPTTQIRYDLPESEFVSINIYDVMGRKIKSLININQEAGYRSITWNATNDLGQPVSAGMYIYTIQAGEFRQTRKMVLLK